MSEERPRTTRSWEGPFTEDCKGTNVGRETSEAVLAGTTQGEISRQEEGLRGPVATSTEYPMDSKREDCR